MEGIKTHQKLIKGEQKPGENSQDLNQLHDRGGDKTQSHDVTKPHVYINKQNTHKRHREVESVTLTCLTDVPRHELYLKTHENYDVSILNT